MMRLEADEEKTVKSMQPAASPMPLPTHHDTFTHEMLYKLRDP